MRKKYFTEEERLAAGREYKRKEIMRLKATLTPEEWDERCRSKRAVQQGYYRQRRRNTKEGYADRLLERARALCKDTDLDRIFILELIEKGCAITGKPFLYENPFDSFHNPYSPSIDQIVPKGGYYRSNVQIMFQCLNRMKNDLKNEDFKKCIKSPHRKLTIAIYIYPHRKFITRKEEMYERNS